MILLEVKSYSKFLMLAVLVLSNVESSFCDHITEYKVNEHHRDRRDVEVVNLDRQRRAIEEPTTTPVTPAAKVTTPSPPQVVTNSTVVATTKNVIVTVETTTLPAAVVTKIPLLGVNGSGILKVDLNNQTKVSDPILSDDNITEIFRETPEQIKAQYNLTDLKYDNHTFYNSTFIGNETYFDEYWANITSRKADTHPILSDSHRRAATLKLHFEFPFYGHPLNSVTVATGGFIYTGDQVHNWLAATQYIAPLMANFDTTESQDSLVKIYEDSESFTALWENVNLQEDKSKHFTFAATLYKNGDIVFAYKHIPVRISDINEIEHPVKVGISDAYHTDRIIFYVRRKTIYEYHRVSFKTHEISNKTLIHLVALPTCLQYKSCDECVNHDTAFNCTWCDELQRCSSGTDRNKQDWLLRSCDRNQIANASRCPATDTTYVMDGSSKIHTVPDTRPNSVSAPASSEKERSSAGVGGVVAAIVSLALVVAIGGWIFYAFKNPHTTSGQLLIKYRPSQWSWKRGEARYTAATIHM